MIAALRKLQITNLSKSIRFLLVLFGIGVCLFVSSIAMLLTAAYLKDTSPELVNFISCLSHLGWILLYISSGISFFSAMAVKFGLDDEK